MATIVNCYYFRWLNLLRYVLKIIKLPFFNQWSSDRKIDGTINHFSWTFEVNSPRNSANFQSTLCSTQKVVETLPTMLSCHSFCPKKSSIPTSLCTIALHCLSTFNTHTPPQAILSLNNNNNCSYIGKKKFIPPKKEQVKIPCHRKDACGSCPAAAYFWSFFLSSICWQNRRVPKRAISLSTGARTLSAFFFLFALAKVLQHFDDNALSLLLAMFRQVPGSATFMANRMMVGWQAGWHHAKSPRGTESMFNVWWHDVLVGCGSLILLDR